ncbi:hypothetical protein PFISCL1PPCAC_25298, partial [Pristionchus fissidentatus]
SASDFIVNEINGTLLIEMFSKKFAGDEQFFTSLTATEALKIPGRFSANCSHPNYLRHVIWIGESPCKSNYMRHTACVFGVEDLPFLKNVKQFIINKV